ncbi:MAG: PQQ-dependent sugar dehydrogenase [Actinomycetota bacterium]|nr:PQQ-dependent sugar dehydrogenase [Actinomycetota bacterium]
MRLRLLGCCLAAAIAVAGCTDDDTGSGDTAGSTGGDASTAPTIAGTDGGATTTEQLGTPAASDVQLVEVVSGLSRPVDLVWRDGDADPYLVQQDGTILRIRDGQVAETVLDVHELIVSEGEQGLLGLAFHPTDALAYVNYTDRDGDTTVAEYGVADDGTLDPASVRTVLQIDQPYANHNGGKIVFGPDGYLYIGMGDGGAADDTDRRALDPSDLLGKMLRIDPAAGDGAPYTIPADNPFVDVAGARPEIWATGLRNPWRFSFDSATGDLWIGDVGQGLWEEIDVAWAEQGGGKGLNFGWSAWEGTHRFNDDQSADGATPPVHEYPHGDDGCSVSGGAVYRGTTISSLRGWYVFADYCSGKVWALHTTIDGTATVIPLLTQGNPSAIVAGPDGELYLLDHNGTVYSFQPA